MKKDLPYLSKVKRIYTDIVRVYTTTDETLTSEIVGNIGFIKEKEFYYLWINIKNEGSFIFALDNVLDISAKYGRLSSKEIQDYNFVFARLYL